MKKTGIELITNERNEQLEKHGIAITDDVAHNNGNQLAMAASILLIPSGGEEIPAPPGWNNEHWQKMINKPYKDRVIIAGALCCAELDRLNF